MSPYLSGWDATKIAHFRQVLLTWYDQQKRDLPWRHHHNPYFIWISEIMLQQTQVATVIPYYNRFIATLPDIDHLATVDDQTLTALWSGLGYYSRARRLRQAAQQLVTDYHGKWPQSAQELQELAGIGPYTSAAIASIAFGEVVPAIDGNAFRVFGRLFKITEDITKPKTRTIYQEVITPLVDPKRPGDFNQAIMDLGATLATPKHPQITADPLRSFSLSYADGTYLDYPVKTKKKAPIPERRVALILRHDEQLLMMKRGSHELLANSLMFPLLESTAETPSRQDDDHLIEQWAKDHNLTLTQLKPLAHPTIKHTFSHRQWTIVVYTGTCTTLDLALFPGQWQSLITTATSLPNRVQQKLWTAYTSVVAS